MPSSRLLAEAQAPQPDRNEPAEGEQKPLGSGTTLVLGAAGHFDGSNTFGI
jgi:hypothetical protein